MNLQDYLLLGGVLLLVILSGFLSGSETSLTAMSISRVHKLLGVHGGSKAFIVDKLYKIREKVVSTMVVGNTIVNITASALATALCITLFGEEEGILIATASVTITILVFGEILPKTYALQNPEKVVVAVSRVTSWVVVMLHPVVLFVEMIVKAIMYVLRINENREVISAAEVMRDLISLHDSEGTMLREDLDMLSSILDLAETEIDQIMTHRKNLVAIDIDTDKNELIDRLLDAKHTRIPLWSGNQDNVVGVIHTKDLVKALREVNNDVSKIEIRNVMMEPRFVPDTTSLSSQLHDFRKSRCHCAIVIDEYGALKGLVTLEDILEEIVGDISDEHDSLDDDMIRSLTGGLYIVNGNAPVRDVNRRMRWNLPDEEASTVAGVIINVAERIPEEGEVFVLNNLELRVAKKNDYSIESVVISKLDDSENCQMEGQ